MPIYADQITRGRGAFRARAIIGGWPYIPVSHRALVRTRSDGRQQITGLDPLSIRVAARADPLRAELREQEMSLELADTAPDYLMTRAFHRQPSRRTWLTASISSGQTSIPVADTAGWPDSGVIHIGTEAIAYGSKDATHFLECTRGYWDSINQAHYLGTGDRVWFPPVTDLPRALTGRRIYFHFYGTADTDNDAPASEAPNWRGVCRTDVDFDRGVYTIAIDPLTRVLEQELGSDLAEEVGIRGVYLPSRACLTAHFRRYTGASLTSVTVASSFVLTWSGFVPDNGDFVAALNAELATPLASFGLGSGASITVQETEDGYEFVYVTGSTAYWVEISGFPVRFTGDDAPPAPYAHGISPVDLWADSSGRQTGRWRGPDGELVPDFGSMLPATEYRARIAAPVPRMVAAPVDNEYDAFLDRLSTASRLGRFYLGGTLVPTSDAQVRIDPGEGDPIIREVIASSADSASAARWVDVGPVPVFDGASAKLKLMRRLARGSVAHLLSAILSSSRALVNAGAMPLLVGEDIGSTSEIFAAIGGDILGLAREYVISEGVTLGELLSEELKLIGCYLALGPTGELTFRRLEPVTRTDHAAAELDSSTVRGAFPKSTMSPEGILTSVQIKQGFDPVESEHNGLTINVRNTTSPTHVGGVLTIAPRSNTVGDVDVSPEDAYRLASAVLSMYGDAYEIISLQAGLESFGLQLGDVVLVTSPLLPGPDGTRGVVQRPARLVGYDWSPWESRGTFELFCHDRRIAGYAPAFPVESQAHALGSTWTLTVTTSGYAPTGTDAADWLAAGDQIRIVERDTVQPWIITGTVTATTATTVTVALDMSLLYALAVTLTANLLPAPGSETWTATVNVTRTTGQSDPFGGTNAVLLTEVAVGGTAFSNVTAVAYTSGHALRVSIFVEKQASPVAFAAVALSYDSGSVRKYIVMRLDAAVAQVRTGHAPSATITDLSVVDLGGWLFVSFADSGESASTVRVEVFPAYGTAYPTIASAATGSVTVYGPRIADATADPDAADPTRAWLPDWGTGEWRLGYDRAPSVDETAPAGRRWAQSDFAFVAGTDRKIGFASGDVDAIEMG